MNNFIKFTEWFFKGIRGEKRGPGYRQEFFTPTNLVLFIIAFLVSIIISDDTYYLLADLIVFPIGAMTFSTIVTLLSINIPLLRDDKFTVILRSEYNDYSFLDYYYSFYLEYIIVGIFFLISLIYKVFAKEIFNFFVIDNHYILNFIWACCTKTVLIFILFIAIYFTHKIIKFMIYMNIVIHIIKKNEKDIDNKTDK